jgi:predicted nucleic acid-binding protein
MLVLDASSIIYAWDNYPEPQFPPLWNWIATQIKNQQLTISSVALEEVAHKTPDCAAWLKNHQITRLPITNAILQDALRIKHLVGIKNDQFHPKGVGENDIFIIATARAHGAELITDEERQVITPKEPTKRKIPAVCSLPTIEVVSLNFIEYIKRSKAVFQ